MDLTELQQKVDVTHYQLYRRMLGLNELPLPLLQRYFEIKKLLDKVDGPMSPCDLVRIALDVGFNSETMRFETLKLTKPVETEDDPVNMDPPQVEEIEKNDNAEPDPPKEPADAEPLTVGTTVKVLSDGEYHEGTINGVNEDGTYSVETEDDVLNDIDRDEIEV